MSNCIFLRNNVVVFTAEDIDIPRFNAYMSLIPQARPAELPNMTQEQQVEHWNMLSAWWYLATNVTINVDMVTIRFGEGRSGHTWRDFRGLRNCILLPFMKRPVSHIFRCSDEDSNGRWYDLPVTFGVREE